MGQRLDRPSNGGGGGGASTSHPSTGTANQVATSMSTTFSSSSSTSSTSSNNGAPTNTVPSTTNLVNVPRTTNNTAPNSSAGGGGGHSRHQHHIHRHSRSRGSGSGSVAQNNNMNSETPTNEMSPRTRFRSEMARRGYTNSSSDLFFRLFQFPPPQANSSTVDPSNGNILPLPATPLTNNSDTTVAQSAPASASAGLSAFRFFNLGGGGSSAINAGDLDSDLTSDEDEPERWNHNMSSLAQSLPFFFGVRDFKCFVCSKQIPADDVEAHIMMCLTKPKLTYNDDILNDDKGECIICFEELEKGQTIARLQCLCIYHKHCIENWLQRSQSCPGHPPD